MRSFPVLWLAYFTTRFTPIVGPPNPLDQSHFSTGCVGGDIESLKHYLSEADDAAEFANARTKDGETCLHLTAIGGSLEVTQIIIDAGADVNARTTNPEGLRMHPLSWHVYGGHNEIVELLLRNGADVNADVDHSIDSDEKVTVLDIAAKNRRGEGTEEEPDEFELTYRILVENGAKKFKDL